jgi:hypothetical protein
LTTHCCYAYLLSALGDVDGELRGVLNEKYSSTCVLIAVKGCENPDLPPELYMCTQLNGHLLNVLKLSRANTTASRGHRAQTRCPRLAV